MKLTMGLTLTAAAVAAAIAGPISAGPARLSATCSAATKATRVHTLKAFELGQVGRRRAYFRAHTNQAARKAFLEREQARLGRLELAASCTVLLTPPAAHVLGTIPVASAGRMTFAADGTLWVNRGSDSSTGTVFRIDPATNQVTATIKLDDSSGADIAYGFGSIWAVNAGTTPSVSRIDPATGAVLATIPTGTDKPAGLAMTAQAVWLANHEPVGSILKIDPTSNRVIDTIPDGDNSGGPNWLASAAGSVWGVNGPSNSIVRIDPISDTVVAHLYPCVSEAYIASDGSTVWASCHVGPGSTIVRVNAASNTLAASVTASVLERYDVKGIFYDAFGGGLLWASGACGHSGCVFGIDPASNTIAKAWTIPASGGGLALAYGADSLWIGDTSGVLRLDPNA